MLRSTSRALLLFASVAVPLAACGETHAPAKVAAVASASVSASIAVAPPPDVTLPPLRTGALAPIERSDVISMHVVKRGVHDADEFLELAIAPSLVPVARECEFRSLSFAIDSIDAASPSTAFRGDETHAWVRRPQGSSGAPIDGDVYVDARTNGCSKVLPGEHARFHASDVAGAKVDAAIFHDWLLAAHDKMRTSTAWGAFASDRLGTLARSLEPKAKGKKKGDDVNAIARPDQFSNRGSDDDLAQSMEMTSGVSSIQQALQTDRALFRANARAKKTIAIKTLEGPKLKAHPWKAMQAALGKTAKPEALASAVPAEFYFLRAASLPKLLGALDQVEGWVTPLTTFANGSGEDRELASRYETALGVERTALTRALGDLVVGEMAIVGSDPYFNEGTDVSLVMRVKDRTALSLALDAGLAKRGADHGGVTLTKRTHAGVEIAEGSSVDGAVHRQRASIDDLEIISNSAGAIDRIVDTIKGAHPNLANEPDFAYMLARDGETRSDLLAYMGDRFLGEVIGPRQKILESRRATALAELSTPGYSALLFGWLWGRSPKDVAELEHAGLLMKDELAHVDGTKITWTPGEAAHSTWGSPRSLTPLIDCPSPEMISAGERAAYTRFRDAYRYSWSHYIDPIALRVAIDATGGTSHVKLDVRQLPVTEDNDYEHLKREVGDARVDVPRLVSGVRAVLGIGAKADIRRELGDVASHVSQLHGLTIDWLGEWAMIGALDRMQIPRTLLTLKPSEVPQMPIDAEVSSDREDSIAEVAKLPIYAAVDIKSAAGAALALAALHAMANDVLPGQISWTQSGDERGVPIVRIAIAAKDAENLVGSSKADLELFYALGKGVLVFGLQDYVVRHVVDDLLDGKAPRAKKSHDDGPQLVTELSAAEAGGLWTLLSWLHADKMIDGAFEATWAAEPLLRGAPERAGDAKAFRELALSYFGAIPIAPDGGLFTLAKDGIHTAAFGDAYAPVWPAIPVHGSPTETFLDTFSHARSELSFDDEGKDATGSMMQSLHAVLTLDVAPSRAR